MVADIERLSAPTLSSLSKSVIFDLNTFLALFKFFCNKPPINVSLFPSIPLVTLVATVLAAAAAASATTARALSVTRTDDAHCTRAKASGFGCCWCFTGSRLGGCTLGGGALGAAFGFAGALGR